jgi:putative N6-adenine-specific DNA methylase
MRLPSRFRSSNTFRIARSAYKFYVILYNERWTMSSNEAENRPGFDGGRHRAIAAANQVVPSFFGNQPTDGCPWAFLSRENSLSDDVELIATAAFGLEAVLARELTTLGYDRLTVRDGRVQFRAELAAICRTNLWLRTADRVLLKIGSFEARDFGELFDQTAALDWARWIPKEGQFPVRGKSVRSQLYSVPNCQAIVKKAIVEKLKQRHAAEWFSERGPLFAVEVSILKDQVTLSIDTSGPGLHKRGYRTLVGEAPLKETLAAALVQLSFWQAERPFLDPFCGSGTIPIEAALLGRNIAPGVGRSFAAEDWPAIAKTLWHDARQEARDRIARAAKLSIVGSDIDDASLSLARKHAQNAQVEADVRFERRAFSDVKPKGEHGCLIANPPYGERSGDLDTAEDLARQFADLFPRFDTWSIYALSALPNFERLCRRTADRRRKLYNGRIPCTYYQFHGPRPLGIPQTSE